MIESVLKSSRIQRNPTSYKNSLLDALIESRNLVNVQTIQYDLTAVNSLDLDPSENFLLLGLSNGSVELQAIQDPQFGIVDHVTTISHSSSNVHRVQWNPGHEEFFSSLDNTTLYLIDPREERVIEQHSFQIKTNWSDWNPNDRKMIAACGSESQTRLVDIRTGDSVHTIILGAPSRLKTHRATRCLWSKRDINCLLVGDNEGYLHVYDTRHTTRPYLLVGEERGQISGMSFTNDHNSIIVSQGLENNLIQWSFDKCTLLAEPNKFKKPPKLIEPEGEGASRGPPTASSNSSTRVSSKKKESRVEKIKRRRNIYLSADAYLRCQFYLTDTHIFCPAPLVARKSKELYIYNIDTGHRVKTLKSDTVLCQDVHSVIGLLPDSLVLYVGARTRLRVWSIDEDHERKMEIKRKKYHTSTWDSDNDDYT